MAGATGLAITASASAIPLASGGTVYPLPGELDSVGGTVVASTGPVPFSAAPNIIGTLTTSVVSGDTSNPYGGLTFVYELTSDLTSANMIGRFTVQGFGNHLTDVSYRLPLVGLQASIADRLSSDVVGFGFLPAPLGAGALPPGGSTIMVIQTDATTYNPVLASVIDGLVSTVPSLAPIPEPASLLLLGAGGLMMIRRRSARMD